VTRRIPLRTQHRAEQWDEIAEKSLATIHSAAISGDRRPIASLDDIKKILVLGGLDEIFMSG
jgi:hypothetical protein